MIVCETLLGRVAPELATHALVQTLSERFRETIRKRLEHDARIVVVRALETLEMRLDADARRHGEGAHVVPPAGAPRRNEVRQRVVRLPVGLTLLLAQEMQPRKHAGARFICVHLHVVVVDAVRREQTDDAARGQPALMNDLLQHAARIRIQTADLFADDGVGEDVREFSAELPGIEERHPVDVTREIFERIVLEDA